MRLLVFIMTLLFVSCERPPRNVADKVPKGYVPISDEYVSSTTYKFDGPNHISCVLKVNINDMGDVYYQRNIPDDGEYEGRYHADIAALWGYQLFGITDTIEDKEREKHFFYYIPSYFDCDITKIVFLHIHQKYFPNHEPQIAISNQKEFRKALME